MTLVFPMAGLSRRFSEAGYAVPKYMLPLASDTCFDRSVAGFAAAYPARDMVFVMQAAFDTPAFVAARLAALGLTAARSVVLDGPTAGQAETVERGLDEAGDGELAIFNIDTFRAGYARPEFAGRVDGYLETFVGEGDGWSFVADDGAGCRRVARTTEKVRISNLCSTGFYQFARVDDFRTALAAERASPSCPELYVAPLYNHLIAAGGDVRYTVIDRAEVTFCGVPAEYEALMAQGA